MWLAPFKNTRSYSAANNEKKDSEQSSEHRVPNYVCLIFDEPKAISAIRLWNYAKTPSRGVNEFELLIDDRQVYRGFAKPALDKADFDRRPLNDRDASTVVLFTSDDKIVERFKHLVNYDVQKQQSVSLINEKKLMNQSAALGAAQKRPP
jgi:hypothetical protein